MTTYRFKGGSFSTAHLLKFKTVEEAVKSIPNAEKEIKAAWKIEFPQPKKEKQAEEPINDNV